MSEKSTDERILDALMRIDLSLQSIQMDLGELARYVRELRHTDSMNKGAGDEDE